MALSAAYEFSETVSTTEWSLTTDTAGPDAQTTSGLYQVFVDLNALAAGDVYELRGYEKIVSGGTQRAYLSKVFSGVQEDPIWVTPFAALIHGFDWTLVKHSGTDRDINWRIERNGTVTEVWSASESVSGTEHSMTADSDGVSAQTTVAIYQPWFDLSALVVGDDFTLKQYEKVPPGGTQRLISSTPIVWGGKQHRMCDAIALRYGHDHTLVRNSANSRTIVASIRKASG
jgi:hypothetical protein